MAEWGQFDVLAHITYPLRYIIGDYGREINLDRFQPLIDKLFYTIIRKGIVLEVNTSGLRQKINATLPDEELLRRYYGLGGRLVTIGSDAHRLRDMAWKKPKKCSAESALTRSYGSSAARCAKCRSDTGTI